MSSITVLEPGDGSISDIIAGTLRALPEGRAIRGLRFLGEAALRTGGCPDLVVVSPLPGYRSNATLRCTFLLVPGTAADLGRLPQPDCVVSYGLSKRDSVTLSSIMDETLVLSLQRELPTLEGTLLERQDIPVPRLAGRRPDELLAAAAALLLLGLPAENLVI